MGLKVRHDENIESLEAQIKSDQNGIERALAGGRA